MCDGHLSLQHLEEGVADLDDLPDVAEEDGGLDPLLLQQVGGVQGEGLGGWRRGRQGRGRGVCVLCLMMTQNGNDGKGLKR